MRIDLAFCIELNRVVDIQEACQEFADQDRYKVFNFLCSDLLCRNSIQGGVRVSGVNHSKIPEEDTMLKTPHFRKHKGYEHIPSCDWMELEAAYNEEPHLDKTEQNLSEREYRRKTTHLIKEFIIPTPKIKQESSKEIAVHLDWVRAIPNPVTRRKELLAYARGMGSTATSLNALVSCFEELRSLNALNEEFFIEGYGNISFRNAFRKVNCGTASGFVVYYGGARLVKRYGKGFSLAFMDKVQSSPVTFFVSKNDMESYRPSSMLAQVVDEMERNKEKKPYLKVYWIGDLIWNDQHQNYNGCFTTPAHIVMRLAYPTETKSGF